MNFSFTRPFIQCILNANSVPGFVREASTLVRFAFKLSLSVYYFSGTFSPLKADAP